MENAEPAVLTDVENRLLLILRWCNILLVFSMFLVFALPLLPGPMERIPLKVLYTASLPFITAFSLRGYISGVYITDLRISQKIRKEFKVFWIMMSVVSLYVLVLCGSRFYVDKTHGLLRDHAMYLAPFAGLVFFFLGRFTRRRRISHLP